MSFDWKVHKKMQKKKIWKKKHFLKEKKLWEKMFSASKHATTMLLHDPKHRMLFLIRCQVFDTSPENWERRHSSCNFLCCLLKAQACCERQVEAYIRRRRCTLAGKFSKYSIWSIWGVIWQVIWQIKKWLSWKDDRFPNFFFWIEVQSWNFCTWEWVITVKGSPTYIKTTNTVSTTTVFGFCTCTCKVGDISR